MALLYADAGGFSSQPTEDRQCLSLAGRELDIAFAAVGEGPIHSSDVQRKWPQGARYRREATARGRRVVCVATVLTPDAATKGQAPPTAVHKSEPAVSSSFGVRRWRCWRR